MSELADKTSVLYFKLWFRENAALVSNARWNGVSLRIHEYLHFAEFYFFGAFCCFSSVPCVCSAWFLVPFSGAGAEPCWLCWGHQGPEPGCSLCPALRNAHKMQAGFYWERRSNYSSHKISCTAILLLNSHEARKWGLTIYWYICCYFVEFGNVTLTVLVLIFFFFFNYYTTDKKNLNSHIVC